MRRSDAVVVLGDVERGTGMPFRFHGSQPCARKFLRLEMPLRARNGRLSRIELGGSPVGGTGNSSRRDGLSRIAHFLYWRTRAAAQAENTDNDWNGAQHEDDGH